MYKYYNPNPVAARVGDCTIRALCCATGEDWETVFVGLALLGLMMADMPSANAVWGRYLGEHGYKRHGCENCYTVKSFASTHNTGIYILALAGHVVALDNGDWCDTWDCGEEELLYFWSKEGY